MDVGAEIERARLAFNHYFLPFLGCGSDGCIIDVGCGFGKYLAAAHAAGFTNVHGVDISIDQVSFGRDRLRLQIERSDAIPFLASRGKSADVVLLIDVLEHFELDESLNLLRAIRGTLKSGGLAIIQVPNALAPFAPTFHGDVTHKRAFSSLSLAQLLRMAGYNDFQFLAMPPIMHGPKSTIRRILWSTFFAPTIRTYFLAAYGTAMGGIYTPNLYAIVKVPLT